jgi:uncharacterized protein (TIGR02996 family)
MPANPLAPPRPELLALLDAIKDNPDEDTPRLVLADWLDEQGNELDSERAAFIRQQVADANTRSGPALRTAEEQHTIRYGYLPGYVRPAAAEYEATRARLDRWLGLARHLELAGAFHRGLPDVHLSPRWFGLGGATAVLMGEAFAFVQLVHFGESGGEMLIKTAARPEFRFVCGFSFAPLGPLGGDACAGFLRSPNLTALRHLDLYRANPGAAGTEALTTNPALGRLRKLVLTHNKLVDKSVVALARSPHLTSLTHLRLDKNTIGDKSAEALAASPAFPNLRELNLRDNPRLTEKGKQLLRDKFGERVRLS